MNLRDELDRILSILVDDTIDNALNSGSVNEALSNAHRTLEDKLKANNDLLALIKRYIEESIGTGRPRTENPLYSTRKIMGMDSLDAYNKGRMDSKKELLGGLDG